MPLRLHPYIQPARIQHPRVAQPSSWSVPDLCRAYRWPTDLVGGGVIGIVELGGGWRPADMAMFFAKLGQPVPHIVDVSVDRTGNAPGGDADGEVALDIQVAAAAYYCATGMAARVRVYWTTDLATGIRAATDDGCAVCSISWGADEADWPMADMDALEQAAVYAVTHGTVVFAASGDNDSSDGGPGAANVDMPASAPHVIGCGGTSKPRHGDAETVWNNEPGQTNGTGTGGGYSGRWAMPNWQIAIAPQAPGRGRLVPDIAACADPDTGYEIVVAGQWGVVGGTSAVAPLYAGLFAAFGPLSGGGVREASIGPTLWTHRDAGAFTDITVGDNGEYRAEVGPDPCTGLGAPVGDALARLFDAIARAPASTPVPKPPVRKPVRRPPPRRHPGDGGPFRRPTVRDAGAPVTRRQLPPSFRIVADPGAPTGRAFRPTRHVAPPIYSIVPPGARKPKGAIKVDAGSATIFRGRTHRR